MLKRFAAVAIFLMFAHSAQADTILYEQEFPTGASYIAWCSSCSGTYEVFDEFTLSTSALVGAVDVRIADWAGTNWTVRVDIATNDNWTSPFFTQTFAPGNYSAADPHGDDTLTLTFDLSDVFLLAGAYELGFYGLPTMGFPGYSGGPGQQVQVASFGTFERGTSGDFTVYGVTAVPDSGSLLLIEIGVFSVLAILASRERRRQAIGRTQTLTM